MLVIMRDSAGDREVRGVLDYAGGHGAHAHRLPDAAPGDAPRVFVVPSAASLSADEFRHLPGVALVIEAGASPAAGDAPPGQRPVRLANGVVVGGDAVVLIAGPCAVESRAQTLQIAHAAREAGAQILRGGAYKPRTSATSFQGLGPDGLAILAEAKAATGLAVVTEVMEVADIDAVGEVADVFQVGARSMQHFPLLRALGRRATPVLLKRGFGSTLREWLCAAEYVLAGGAPLILCERGVRGFSDFSRHTLDLSAVAAVKADGRLAVIADPSHAAGRRDLVPALALAAIAAGADGVMLEVHHDPVSALSDGPQALTPAALAALVPVLDRVARAIGRRLADSIAAPGAHDHPANGERPRAAADRSPASPSEPVLGAYPASGGGGAPGARP